MLEVFKLALERVEKPVASALNAIKSDAANAGMNMVDALMRGLEEAENAKTELAKINMGQEEVKENHDKKIEKSREECVEEIVAWKAMALERHESFPNVCATKREVELSYRRLSAIVRTLVS